MGNSFFPSTLTQVTCALVHLLGITILTHCISRRLATEDLSSWESISQMTWPRLCVLLVFVDSWLFVFTSCILIYGIGLELRFAICATAIYICIAFYATSKILIYFYLIEKVHVVWSPTAGVKRFRSRVYILCFFTVSLYAVVITLMLIGRIHFFREGDFACVIGLRPLSSIPLLSYDLYINVFLSALFLWPLMRVKMNARVRRVAMRTLLASAIALTTSAVNMVVLTVLHGQELGWVCLASCAADVITNALALFWVTGGSGSSSQPPSPAGPSPSKDRNGNGNGTQLRGGTTIGGGGGGQFPSILGSTITTSHLPKGIDLERYSPAPISPFGSSTSPRSGVPFFEGGGGGGSFNSLERALSTQKYTGVGARNADKPSVFRSMVTMLKRDSVLEEQGLQITVTTEFELDETRR